MSTNQDALEGSQFTRETIPDQPTYDTDETQALDDALENALEAATEAGNDYLEHLLICELGSLRYGTALNLEGSQ